ncbi:MAG: hypothetical protein J6B17_03485 [Ruminococcus sp.]|nr:hypothetical protein [Ruminococcus sp.]
MITFRIFGVSVRAEFSFITVCALICTINNGSMLKNSLFAAVLHEMAHLTAMLILGIGLKSVSFHGCGVRIYPEDRLLSYGKEIFILLAGPSSNLIMFLILYHYNGNEAAAAQLGLGLMNLMPCRNLDGGRVLRCCLSITKLDSHTIYSLTRIISISVILLLTAAGFISGVRNFTYYALMLYLFFSEFFG